MKEVKKEIQTIDYKTVYEATDGTTFEDKVECKKYEESALGMMRAKIQPLIVGKKSDAWELMGGCDDHQVIALVMPTEKDLDTVIQWFFLEHPWILSEGNEGSKKKLLDTINKAYHANDVLLFGINCDEDYYFINSRQNIINNLNNIDREEPKDAQ